MEKFQEIKKMCKGKMYYVDLASPEGRLARSVIRMRAFLFCPKNGIGHGYKGAHIFKLYT